MYVVVYENIMIVRGRVVGVSLHSLLLLSYLAALYHGILNTLVPIAPVWSVFFSQKVTSVSSCMCSFHNRPRPLEERALLYMRTGC